MGLISGPITAALQYAATQETNETNLQINRETNQANKDIARETNEANIRMNAENNALQQELAEKAYQRSTAQNQIAELIRAGYTQQQAMMAVLGSGDAASMPMPTTNPGHADPVTMNPATMVPPDLSAAAGATSDIEGGIFGALSHSLTAEDGGALGWSVAQDYISGLMQFAEDGKIDFDDLGSPADLMDYCSHLPEGDLKTELNEFLHGKAAKKVRGFVPAQRALYSFLRSNMGFKTSSAQVKQVLADTELKWSQKQLNDFKITSEVLNQALTTLNMDATIAHTKVLNKQSEYIAAQTTGQHWSNKLLEHQEEFVRLTQPSQIESTIERATLDLDIYMTELQNRRLNKKQINELFADNLNMQAAVLYCQMMVGEYESMKAGGLLDQITNAEGDMKGFYKLLGACKDVGLDLGKIVSDVVETGTSMATKFAKPGKIGR